MPLYIQAQTSGCPKCGNPGPLNFRQETLVSVRITPTAPHLEETGQSTVLVCIKCGHRLGDPVPQPIKRKRETK